MVMCHMKARSQLTDDGCVLVSQTTAGDAQEHIMTTLNTRTNSKCIANPRTARSPTKPPLLSFLPYTLNKQSQHIGPPVGDDSQ